MCRHSRASNFKQGGIYAIANIRGGGEYGESWHNDGMLKNKQNVFDDFIAAGEALTGKRPVRLSTEKEFAVRKYTNRKHLGITGGSNGGLLTGAVLVQRPDLWAAVISDVPLLDMLRFHLTQGGKFWMSEYGNPDNPEDFEWLFSYSPYHNVKDSSNFPPTLLKTSLHDDRGTDSLHAFKMTAKLQAANSSDNPILLRTMTNVGHGAGRTTQMTIDEQTEIFLFLVKHLM
ncbi:MAG: prolyl oligopeptidase family serine peptidase [Candidatus Aegiribacteria sp.]|nr:prolyl oligopeptidase family serine peptidase [Candidatus Aegiribacteria sp.]